jgi:hypothetical protein
MNNFTEESYAAFREAASERYDFSTCQRSDGSYYGTGGTCRKGSPVSGGVPKGEKAAKSGGGGGGGLTADQKAEQLRQINAQEGRGGGVGKEGRSPVGKKGIVSDAEKAGMSKSGGGGTTATPGNAAKTKAAAEKLKADKKAGGGVRQDRKEEAKRKEQNKAQKERDAKRQKNVEINKKVEANNKKIEQLRKQHQKLPFGDKKKSAMMEEIDKLNKDTKSLLTRSTQGPQQRPQTGGAAGQRRAQAAANARD